MSGIDLAQPLNRAHPFAPDAWWLPLPGLLGGRLWHNLCALSSASGHAVLTNQAGPPSTTSGWQQGPTPPGGTGAVAFDGSNDYGDCGDLPLWSARLAAFTILVEVYPRSASPFPGIVGRGNSDSSTSGSYLLYMHSNVTYACLVYTGNSRSTTLSANAVVLNTWQQVAVTYQRGGPARLYVGGVLWASSTAANADVDSPAYPLLLGSNQGNAGPSVYPGNLLLGQVRWYRRFFSDQAMRDLYRHSRAGSPGLLRRVAPRRLGVAAPGGGPAAGGGFFLAGGL